MKLLEELVLTPGVPGREERVRALIERETQGLFDETRVDPMGSLIGVRKPRPASGPPPEKPLKVMLAAHMDQIGFLVKFIDDKGFVRINPVGGFDTRNLFARMVTICARDGDLPGVLNPSGKPVHIATADERKKIPELHEFAIDLGLPVEEVKQKVRIGDMVVLRAPFTEVGATVVSQCMDNRIACWLAIRSLQQMKHHDCEIHCVFTSQEEVGVRGAATAAYGVKPDVGIGIDVTLCVDTPGVPDDQCVTRQGEGAALTIMDSYSISDIGLIESFEKVAEDRGIKHQRSILAKGGTDAAGIQRAGAGAKAMTFSCPTRYIHTVTEMVHKDDLFACRDLLAAWLEQAGR